MPVIVTPEDYGKSLGEDEADPVRLLQMLKPFSAEAMTAFPVDARVGNVKNDEPALLEPSQPVMFELISGALIAHGRRCKVSSV